MPVKMPTRPLVLGDTITEPEDEKFRQDNSILDFDKFNDSININSNLSRMQIGLKMAIYIVKRKRTKSLIARAIRMKHIRGLSL